MASQDQGTSHGSEEANMPLSHRELLVTVKEMMELIIQNKEAQQTTPNSPETSSKMMGESAIQKLVKFRKFAPKPFKEAKDPRDVVEWREEFEGILETLKIEEEDKIFYIESLLQGEARILMEDGKKETRSGA